ncbi:peptide/nickel transport system permease protein [Hymenobacter gelipurpurascens]|uniref:Peptide/nickel transport system permease protein n=1 Tax=Hymenobacter gelipurpurascens TaxID=89968 RepID=A0A212UAX2_9BACT|nr:ABC transporter permease [Hymenobacter gelipurpurascens]SNC75310.1 peptide/nickel transport system permease protein [Hymenobacter gelipurpurascens]
MQWSRYLLLRLALVGLAAWAILSCIFLLSRLTSQDDVVRAAFDGSTFSPTISATEKAQAENRLRQRYGLDVPLFYFSISPAHGQIPPAWQWHGTPNQYHRWLTNLLRGDLGTSYREDAPVTGLLAAALQYTLPLTALAAFFSLLITLELSIWLGYHPRWRQPVLAFLHAIQSLPLFVIALGLLLLLANPDVLAWFPAYGLGNDEAASPWAHDLGQYLYHVALPLFSLVLVSIPGLIIQLDASIQQELPSLYVATARAKGAPPRVVIRKHIVRNALLPVLPLLTELLPNMVAGSVVVEMIYALPGMGRLLAEAASTQDFPVLLGAVLLVALVRLLSQLLTDLLYQWADPRIRLSV